jgi:serine palmitoyltransferase
LGKKQKKGYAELFKSWESFYTRRLYHRIQDCWNRPIASAPKAHFDVMERVTTDNNCSFHVTGKTMRCLNLASYNYLGFADDWKVTCRADVMKSVDEWPISLCSSRMDFGTISIHRELEETVAKFVGKEAAMIFSMGYNTNTSTIATIAGPGSLIVSDSLNHLSIVNGARASPAQIRVFRNNDIAHLEEVLREAIVNGQPKHHRPWRQIWVMVEGIYSMEGVICKLADIVQVCKKYKTYLYVDEAHSIGALGATGKGVCEHTGVNPADIGIVHTSFTPNSYYLLTYLYFLSTIESIRYPHGHIYQG